MHLQLNNFHMANEVLYALEAAKKTSVGYLSRLTLQKTLYLSGALAPLKKVFLEYLRFISHNLGPYRGEIQETVDHLVGIGLVDIIYFDTTNHGGSLSNYVISDTGEEVIKRLVQYPYEEDKYWWISLVTGLAFSYLMSDGLSGSVDDKIKSIIYQDPTYTTYKEKNLFKKLIDLSDKDGLTYQYSEFLKAYVHESTATPSDLSERKQVEIMLVTFMEYLYTGVLNEVRNESSKA